MEIKVAGYRSNNCAKIVRMKYLCTFNCTKCHATFNKLNREWNVCVHCACAPHNDRVYRNLFGQNVNIILKLYYVSPFQFLLRLYFLFYYLLTCILNHSYSFLCYTSRSSAKMQTQPVMGQSSICAQLKMILMLK